MNAKAKSSTYHPKKIVCAVDLKKDSKDLINAALSWGKTLGAKVLFVHGYTPLEQYLSFGPDMLYVEHALPDTVKVEEQLRERLEKEVAKHNKEGVEVETHLLIGKTIRSICDFIEKKHPDLFFMKVKEYGIMDKILVGSNANQLLTSIDIPMLCFKAKGLFKPKKVLYALDFLAHDNKAYKWAQTLFQNFQCGGKILHIVSTYNLVEDLKKTKDPVLSLDDGFKRAQVEAEKNLDRVVHDINENVLKESTSRVSYEVAISEQEAPDKLILDLQEREHYDLIIMGTHNRKGLSRWFMGSVSEEVINRSPVPVFLAKG